MKTIDKIHTERLGTQYRANAYLSDGSYHRADGDSEFIALYKLSATMLIQQETDKILTEALRDLGLAPFAHGGRVEGNPTGALIGESGAEALQAG